MSTARALAIVVVAVAVMTGVLAIVSRTPRATRADRPPPGAADASHGARFTPAEVARNGRFQAPNYLAFAFRALLEILVLVVIGLGPFRRLVNAVQGLPGTWAFHAALLALVVTALLVVVTLPLNFITGYAMGKAWGLSTQNPGGWLSDQARGLLVAAIVSGVTAVAFYGAVRWQPRLWPVLGFVVLAVITTLVTYLYPVVIAPLFNRFTPLHDPPLTRRIDAVASDAGVRLDQILVADASRRTTAENAYVAGLGSSKRLVVYDTLLRSENPDGTVFIVAHELGHEVSNHVAKGLALGIAGLAAAFGLLALLDRTSWFWSWAGAKGVADLKSIPVLLLFGLLANLVTLPVTNTVSRHFESTADHIALELTHDPRAGTEVFRKLAFSNLADLRPPRPAVWVLFTHPPIPDRVDALLHPGGSSS